MATPSPALTAHGVEPTIAPSPAGPLPGDTTDLRMPPELALSAVLQTLRFGVRPLPFKFRARRELGETWQVRLASRSERIVVTDHPDHVKSLFTAGAHEQHSLTGESPLRPVLGPNSVLTAIGPRHMRQRKLLLPSFHGDAVRRYSAVIQDAIDRELAGWRPGQELALAPRMQAVTLDVIMSGVFGIDGVPAPGTPEGELRRALRRLLGLATQPWWALVDLQNMGRDEPVGVLRRILDLADRRIHAVIAQHRAKGPGGGDVLSLLLEARDEEGRRLTDGEVRDELMALLLAGHETTANSLAWTFERLVRFPGAYARLREEARATDGGGEDGAGRAYVEATAYEGMRVRPVIPMVGRVVHVPWRLGDFQVPAGTPIALSILLLHHREDLYADPHRFLPERWLGRKPGTYTWIPFGGGTRRCLGAALAMAELRIVLQTMAARVDLEAVDPRSEGARQRNVTTIPQHGGRVRVTALR